MVVFTIIYGLISLVDHAMYRTYALDLGLYTNASWKYAHFMRPDRSMFRWDHDSILADHFDLHLLFWSPLTYLLGEWTLLIVQILSIPIGAYGVYKLVRSISNDAFLATAAMCCTLTFYGVFTALAFDYHTNVVVSMALPWYFYFLYHGRITRSWMVLLFMLAGKENIGIWLGVVAVAALFVPFLKSVDRKTLLLQSATAFIWSFLVILLIMPAMDHVGEYHQMSDYAVLGGSMSEVIRTLLTRPWHVLSAMVTDLQGTHEHGTAIKREFFIVLLISGGWALFRQWPFLLMVLPLLAQKMLHGDPAKWGLFSQYSIEFSVVLPIAVFAFILTLRTVRMRRALAVVSVALCAVATGYTLYLPIEHADPLHGDHDRLRFFSKKHYTPYRDHEALSEAFRLIPPYASVSALSPLVPHLVRRPVLYQYPIVWDAEYVLIAENAFPWPLTSEEYATKIVEFRTNGEWDVVMDRSDILLFRRKVPEAPIAN